MTEPARRGRLVVFGGQSNMLGHRTATDGAKPTSSLVRAWDNGGAAGTWRQAELGHPPFNVLGNPKGDPADGPANNAALHFAVALAERTGDPVLLVGAPVNGSSIVSWQDESAVNLERLLTECRHALASEEAVAAGVTHADTMLWHQGETDDEGAWMVKDPRLTDLPSYVAAFERMRSTLARQSWWADDTRFIAGELVRDGWLSARNDFYGAGALNGPRDAVVSSEGLGHVGDRAHFDGRALQLLGERMFEARLSLG
ncbi:sialate O-acetylesterase [Nocardioides stalactiti]|uniref:sialate O-acetylesterase n=1 Tax=Nocardioides stalactiti TaxID=2755356 RepID=UPI001603CD51|nr:sialate O-acetylesterase [Nocardioides stalactiti]